MNVYVGMCMGMCVSACVWSCVLARAYEAPKVARNVERYLHLRAFSSFHIRTVLDLGNTVCGSIVVIASYS